MGFTVEMGNLCKTEDIKPPVRAINGPCSDEAASAFDSGSNKALTLPPSEKWSTEDWSGGNTANAFNGSNEQALGGDSIMGAMMQAKATDDNGMMHAPVHANAAQVN